MGKVEACPKCGSKSQIKEKDGIITYKAVQDKDAFKKIGQLKTAMQKFKAKAEQLEKELKGLKSNKN
ncbi:hypothetical protein [Maribacter sp. 1_MG-2023]|uniref:hypothetical protein n=1 Tax=Maribacter sp. 1_MG-2023 TaxID=3062677 RepID=UPI0026E31B49|nr:hypothetical protein [Maribacter sp. 1_MG-2023]MDO6473291.1 hypothetical protein [Maribacter sp. 1_MG-2023]